MTAQFAALLLAAGASSAQVAPPRIAAPIAPVVRPSLNLALPPCMLAPPPGDAIIGEKIVGEKVVGEKVIGEKVIGEKSVGSAALTFGDQWRADVPTRFNHVLVGPPGKVTLTLYGCSSASGGETVSVYQADANGNRKLGWRLFVIASRNGNVRQGTLTLPKPSSGQPLSRLPIVVVVENASKRANLGEYRLTISR